MTPAGAAQLPLGVQLPDTATFATYVPGPNGQALNAARAVAAGSIERAFFWGPAGAGKTHLLQAACRAAALAGRRCAYLPLGEASATPALLAGLASLDLVCLDQIDAIAGARDWEQALVGALDGLRAAGAGLLAAARQPPAAVGLTLPDLSTRLGWGGVYALRELAEDDKRRLLVTRAGARGLKLPPSVCDYLLARAPRDVPSLLGLLERLDAASLAAQRRLTVPFVRQVLEQT